MFAVGAVQEVCRASRRLAIEFEKPGPRRVVRAVASCIGYSAGRGAIISYVAEPFNRAAPLNTSRLGVRRLKMKVAK